MFVGGSWVALRMVWEWDYDSVYCCGSAGDGGILQSWGAGGSCLSGGKDCDGSMFGKEASGVDDGEGRSAGVLWDYGSGDCIFLEGIWVAGYGGLSVVPHLGGGRSRSMRG